MSDSYTPEAISDHNQEAQRQLTRLIQNFQGEFCLILAQCNCGGLRQRIDPQTQLQSKLEITSLTLKPDIHNLYTAINQQIASQPQPTEALMVLGLESVQNLEHVLSATNQIREEFRNLPFPIVFWVTEDLLTKLIRLIPDFYSWAVHVEFMVSNGELIACIEKTFQSLLETILSFRENIFLDNNALNLERNSPRYLELQASYQELLRRKVSLPPELEASMEFIMGRVADNSSDVSRQHYERSLKLWQTSENLELQGHVLFHLGSWWRNHAARHRRREVMACQQAKSYFRQCLDIFEEINRLDLVARFVNSLAEVLHRLQAWQELEEIANQALAYHRAYSNQFRKARIYGFLAEIALAKSQLQQAEQYAHYALSLLSSATAQMLNEASPTTTTTQCLELENSFHQGWYLFSLARAQQQLGKEDQALTNLELARKNTKPFYDPQLYIGILAQLRENYFQRQEYLQAFKIKQEKQTIESQFNLRSFIGASRLPPDHQVSNPTSPMVNSPGIVAHEITSSGRQRDIQNLLERIQRDDLKLTIVHGQSGVGKSSLLEAGLVPALESDPIAHFQVIPVLHRVYNDWLNLLGQNLGKKLAEKLNLPSPPINLDTPAAIFSELQKYEHKNLLTVLIFDQFEEFFLICKEPQQRRKFYQFLCGCLNTPFVKVIISLREDFLPFLLECNNRLISIEAINNNVLDKQILYYLGNFPQNQAITFIKKLTKSAHYPLEDNLIEALVNDLIQETGEVLPIELQIIGSQLENDGIVNLEQYRKLGSDPKAELVHRYLESVIKDCGEENQQASELLLYLLTDENNTRPLKTHHQLIKELEDVTNYLETKPETINLALDVFVESGLVFLVGDVPSNSYQLVHDYLVFFIRQRQGAQIKEQLEAERKKRLEAEAQQQQAESRFLEKQLKDKKRELLLVASSLVMALVTAITIWQLQINELAQRQNSLARLNLQYQLLISEKKQLNAFLKIIQAGKYLHNSAPKSDLEQQTLENLWKAIYFSQERNRLDNHQGSVLSVNFSPDGDWIASGDKNGKVKLWSRQGKLMKTFAGHDGTVWYVSFSPDGKIIASAGRDNTIKLWSTDGELLKTLTDHTDPVKYVSFSPDGQTIASASNDNTIKLWRVDGTLIKTLAEHKDRVLSVAWSLNGNILASASADKTVKLWSEDGELLQTLDKHQQGVWSVHFSPDGKLVATGSDDATIKLWNRDGTLHRTLKGHNEAVNNVMFSPDGQYLASASNDKTIKLWTRDGSLIYTLPGHRGTVNQVSFNRDGKTLASASTDGSISLWDLTHILPKVFEPSHEVYGFSASLAPDGHTVASASRNGYTVQVWRLHNGKLLRELRGHTNLINNVSFSPNGELLASASQDNTVRLWDARENKLLRVLRGHQGGVNSVVFSPDGKLMASASDDKTVRLWQRNGKLLKTLAGYHDDAVQSVSFNAQNKLIASAGDDNKINIFNLEGKLIKTLTADAPVSSVSFSPTDSQFLVAANAVGSIQMWQSNDSSWQDITKRTTYAHGSNAYKVSFSPDGELIASASRDGTVKVWGKDGLSIATLKEDSIPVWSVLFSPNHDQLVAFYGEENKVMIWSGDGYMSYGQLNIDTLREIACTQIQDYLLYSSPVNVQEENLCDF